ncbi:hypothetical protein MRB53_035125 [Persea americana]|uniref:Uncharacterized protein n=1 Tax=Persea americana TaxID=3435 RepID=A0ACC2K411_PERAE|nr:hypothetical protein MRB53_035125 [Persea americana]
MDLPIAEKKKMNKYVFACSLVASMNSILSGYDTAVLSGAILYIQDYMKINDTESEILMGSINIYCLIGSTVAGRISDWIGRRYTIVIAAMIFFVGALMMAMAPNYAFLMSGRFVAGIGVGFAFMIAPVYTAEVAPASTRGFFTSFPEIFVNAGVLLGYIADFAFSPLPTYLNWRLMLGAGAIPAAVLGIAILFMPESPRWLVMQGRLGDAKMVLEKTSDSSEEAEMRLAEIKEASGISEHLTDDIIYVPRSQSNGSGVWRELLIRPMPEVRQMLIISIGIFFFQQASGIDAVVLYSPSIFRKAGIKSRLSLLGTTMAVGFSKTIFVLVSTYLVDSFGRRPLLLTSTMGMFFCQLLLATGLTVIDNNPDKNLAGVLVVCIIMVLSLVAFFSSGLGPITWVYSSEILPSRLRAQGLSFGVATNRVVSGVIGMTFISLYKAITIGGVFFLFAGVTALSWIFFYLYLPETRGKTLEELETLFEKPTTQGKTLDELEALFEKINPHEENDSENYRVNDGLRAAASASY